MAIAVFMPSALIGVLLRPSQALILGIERLGKDKHKMRTFQKCTLFSRMGAME